jgi:hypothetical protein
MLMASLVVALCNTQPGPELCVEEIAAYVPYEVCKVQAPDGDRAVDGLDQVSGQLAGQGVQV